MKVIARGNKCLWIWNGFLIQQRVPESQQVIDNIYHSLPYCETEVDAHKLV
jgi:hypothetical protein